MTLEFLSDPIFFGKVFPEEKSRNSVILSLILLLFAVVEVFGMLHHEMWRDELEPWLVGSFSSNLVDFFQNMKRSSNPYGWYLILHFVSQISLDPHAVQLVHFVFSVSAVYLFLRFSPFNVFQKSLFCFGYYTLFEYGVISRGYALTVFFLFLFCILFDTFRSKRIILLGVVIFFLANATGGFGVILSISFLVLISSNYFFEEKPEFHNKQRDFKYFIATVLLILFSIWFAMKTMLPPPDSVYASTWCTHFEKDRFVNVLWRMWYGFVPIPNLDGINFWNTNFVVADDAHPSVKYILTFFSMLFLGINTLIFSRKLSVLLFYLSGTIGILLFSYMQESIFFINAARYHGFLFLVFVVSLWLFSHLPDVKRINIPILTFLADKSRICDFRHIVFSVYLILGIFGAGAAFIKDYQNRFSGVEQAGRFIVNNKLEHIPMAGFIDCTVAPITAFTRHPFYYPDRDTVSTFPIWTTHHHTTEMSRMMKRLCTYISEHDSVLIVLNSQLDTTLTEHMYFSQLAKFNESVVSDENIYIYMAKH